MRAFRLAMLLGQLIPLAGYPATAALAAEPAAASSKAQYILKLSNIDDTATAYVNGRQVGRCKYNKICSITLDPYLVKGKNKLKIDYRNRSSGYTWGYQLSQDGKVVASGKCGKVRKVSCGPGEPVGTFKVISKVITVR